MNQHDWRVIAEERHQIIERQAERLTATTAALRELMRRCRLLRGQPDYRDGENVTYVIGAVQDAETLLAEQAGEDSDA